MNFYKKINISAIIVSIFLIFSNSFGQFDPNPELEWFTIETEHFYIHYHAGAERTANTVAEIAEDIYGPITSLYNCKPKDKTSLIINDESDFSNGATDFYGNRIEIAAVSLDYELRGTHNWLRNVITHEFTHVIQIQAAMKFSTRFPSIYLQYLGYEKERRPDVLYGYPNTIISYPFSGVVVPAWFAEGTAQYQRQQTGYDYWDAHRDMILRMRVLDNDMLTWNQMGQFASVTSYSAESIYNLGYSLVRYISSKYGEDKLREISRNLSDITTLNGEGAFKKAIGKSGEDLYNEWVQFLKKDYAERMTNLNKYIVEGKEIADVGFANYYPQFSPDGKKIAYVSNKTYDYGSVSLFIHETGIKRGDKMLIAGVSGGFSWSPDGKKIIFARRNKPTIHSKSVFDLYEYDIDKDKEIQITFTLRAHAPAYSPDGKFVTFVVNCDGTQNLCIAENPDGSEIKKFFTLTNFKNGEQIYTPRWSPDSKYIIFDYSKTDQRSIARLNISTKEIEFLFHDPKSDFRNPVYSPDGNYIYLASDRTGIFNIYRYNIKDEETLSLDTVLTVSDRIIKLEQITNMRGGAFMPSADKNNNIVYSGWKSSGYKIFMLENIKNLNDSITRNNAVYIRPEKLLSKYASQNKLNSSEYKNNFDWESLKNFNDDNPKINKPKKYRNVATPLFLIPVLRFDTYNKSGKFIDAVKPGLYFYSQDVLGKMGIFGGASVNKLLERDLFLQFDYNNGVPFFKDFFIKSLGFVPNFQIAGYNVTRKTDAKFLAGIDTIPVDITYDLLQFDFLMGFKIINASHNLKFGFTYSTYSSKFNTFLIPGTGLQVPSTSTNYYKGIDLSLTYTYNNFKPYKNDDINPIGRHIRLRYDREINQLNPELQIDQNTGSVITVFQKANFHRLEGEWDESFQIFNSHAIGFRLKSGAILGKTQDNFFDFYISGFPGMKGYPFYSIGGNRYAHANIYYRLPVFQNIDFKFLQFYLDKIYLSIYGDFGNAWNSNKTRISEFKKDIGAELRLQAYSYYVYPTAFAFNAAYGIDEFKRIFPTTTSEKQEVKYGKEWRFYFTVLFGFDFFVDNERKLRL